MNDTMEAEMARQMQRVSGCVGCVRAIKENHGGPVQGCRCWQLGDEVFKALSTMPSNAKATLADFLLEGTRYQVTARFA